MNRSGNSFFSIMPPVTKHLIIINVLIWLAMMFVGKIDNMMIKYGALHYVGATDFNVLQLFTYMFMHSTQSIARWNAYSEASVSCFTTYRAASAPPLFRKPHGHSP